MNKVLSKEDGLKELKMLGKLIDKMKTPALLCHSDPVPQNMIYDSANGVQIIMICFQCLVLSKMNMYRP